MIHEAACPPPSRITATPPPKTGEGDFGFRDFASDSPSGDQVLSLCITSPNSSQVSPLKRDSCTAWTG